MYAAFDLFWTIEIYPLTKDFDIKYLGNWYEPKLILQAWCISSTDLDKSQTLDGTYKRFCKKVSPPLIDSCNASGTAGFRDPDIEQACALYESVFDGKYRNIFCFLCNEPRPYRLEELQQLVTTDSLIKVGRFDFAALLDFSGQVEGDPVEVDQCNITQFLDVATVSSGVKLAYFSRAAV